jgi:hypothetical protein
VLLVLFCFVLLFDTSQIFYFFSDRVATYPTSCLGRTFLDILLFTTVTVILPRIFSLLDRELSWGDTKEQPKKNNDVLCVVGVESFHHQSTLAFLETYTSSGSKDYYHFKSSRIEGG